MKPQSRRKFVKTARAGTLFVMAASGIHPPMAFGCNS